MSKTHMNLALKMAIHASGKRQKRIAKLARIEEPRLSLIVNGRVEATPDEKKNLTKALKKSQDELFPSLAVSA